MKRLILVFVLALMAAACGGEQISEQLAEQAIGGNADVDISGDGDDVTVNIQSDDGSLSLGSGASLPDELMIPVPDGGKVTLSGVQGESVFAAIQYSADRYDEIIAFYDSWTDGTGDEWQTQTATIDINGQTQRSATWSSADFSSFIAAADCTLSTTGEIDAVCVTINQS
jgi:ABC-type glycerol-3-phosphate transport system substrate-binding protein